MILEKSRNAAIRDDNLEEKYEARPIPLMTFCKNVLKLPGQDISQFNNWPWKVQANQKVLHIEVDKEEIKFIAKLIEFAKEKKLFEEMWGGKVHVSKVVGKYTSEVSIKRLIYVPQNTHELSLKYDSRRTGGDYWLWCDWDGI